MITEILFVLILIFLAWDYYNEFQRSISLSKSILRIPQFISEAILDITWRDVRRIAISLLIIFIVYRNTEITAFTVTFILVISLLIPERFKLTEKAWTSFSPVLDSVQVLPSSQDLSMRFRSSLQSFKDGWKGFRRSLLSVVGLLMVVLVIDVSLLADELAREHQDESLTGQEQWPIYMNDPDTAADINRYAYKKLPPFSGPQVDSVTSFPSDADQKLQLDVQNVNGEDDNDGDLVTNFLDNDDDNDGIMDFMDFMFPMDFDEDRIDTCDEDIWFDNTTNMFCGPDWADLDDDGDGIPDYDEVSDGDPMTNIYDTNNDGIQESAGSASGSTAYLRIYHDTGADPSSMDITLFSVKPLASATGQWDCGGCESGIATGTHGAFQIDQSDGNWTYMFSTAMVPAQVATTTNIILSGATVPTGVLSSEAYDTTVPTGVLSDGTYSTSESTGVLTNGIYIRDNTSIISVDSVDATTAFIVGDKVYDNSERFVGTIEAVTATTIWFTGNLAVELSENEDLHRGQTYISVDSVDATTVFENGDRLYDSSGTVVGTIEAVSATQINLTGNLAISVSDNEDLHRGQTYIPVDSVDATTVYASGDRVYDSSGTLIGTIEAVTATQINLTGNLAISVPDNDNLNREKTIDGVSVRPGDMVLVKEQSDPSENGIYVASSESWRRVPIAIEPRDFTAGKYVWIEEGDTYSNQMLEITNSETTNSAPTTLSFTQFPGVWTDNFSIQHTDSSGQVSEYAVNLSISRLDDAPINPNPLSSPAPNKEDEWYAIEIPDNSHAVANLSVPSGSDYNLFLYGKRGNDIDSSRQDNGCPDFYSYGPLTVLGYEIISEDDLLCPMGTTHTGSDMMSKILYGSRKSLRVGFVVAFTTCFLGLVIGGVSGYFGRWVDEVIMRIADVFFAVPGLILAMAVVAAMNDVNDLGAIGMPDVKLDRLEKIMIALVFTGWPGYSRLIRGQVLYVKEHTYIEAAKSVGSGNFRILFRHVLPNAWAPMLVAVSLDIGGTILTAAGLSFIGLGADALSAEWGKMISDGRSFFPEHWWMVTFPGLAILITTLGFNLLGDGLRDVFDPKQRRSKT